MAPHRRRKRIALLPGQDAVSPLPASLAHRDARLPQATAAEPVERVFVRVHGLAGGCMLCKFDGPSASPLEPARGLEATPGVKRGVPCENPVFLLPFGT
jgi:hypothetical protein